MSAVRVVVNGDEREIAGGTTVAQLITGVAGTHRGSAVVVDGVVVPRSRWDEQTVDAGAVVELITAVQGG